MLTEPQQKHLKDATKGLTDLLNKEEIRRLCFLVDDILQYGCTSAAFVIYRELNKTLEDL